MSTPHPHLNPDDELVDLPSAARLFVSALEPRTPDAQERWERYLRNNRNPKRNTAHRIPSVKIGSKVWFKRCDITAAIELEKIRHLGGMKLSLQAAETLQALGIGQGGSTTGYRWPKVTIIKAVDEVTKKPFLQLQLAEPRLTVYRLEIDEATAFVTEMGRALLDFRAAKPTSQSD